MMSRLVLATALALVPPALSAQTPTESMHFGVEWRFVRAGEVNVSWTSDAHMEMTLKSTGLVASLYKVNDVYKAAYDPGFCVTAAHLEAHEGRRNRDTRATFDRAKKRGSYLEKDLNNGATLISKEIDIPACVHDISGGLRRLRQLRPAVGSSIELPLSDGKKVIMARVEAQARETINTPLGQYSAIRYEAFLFNGVFYARKGRLFIWITEDEKRLPVQLRVQLPFYVGTITLQLEKVQ